MARVLLTGFEPFGEYLTNPSWDAVELVGEAWTRPHDLVTKRLPVAFGSAGRRLMEHVTLHTPDAVVVVGVAPGRAAVTPERVAVNLRDARIPDNNGRLPIEEPVKPAGPAAYFSTLPVGDIVAALLDAGIAAAPSLSAGAYVCNDTFYALQHSLAGLGVASGLIHVPATPAMALDPGMPMMSLSEVARALSIAIDTTLAAIGNR